MKILFPPHMPAPRFASLFSSHLYPQQYLQSLSNLLVSTDQYTEGTEPGHTHGPQVREEVCLVGHFLAKTDSTMPTLINDKRSGTRNIHSKLFPGGLAGHHAHSTRHFLPLSHRTRQIAAPAAMIPTARKLIALPEQTQTHPSPCSQTSTEPPHEDRYTAVVCQEHWWDESRNEVADGQCKGLQVGSVQSWFRCWEMILHEEVFVGWSCSLI